jgi:hypothetical protein
MDDDPNLFLKPGPNRKLKLVLELLLVMMRLRLGFLVHDLACHFQISDSLVSSIFITWIQLMRLELSHLIVWPAKHVIKENRPLCFKKFYPHVRCIIAVIGIRGGHPPFITFHLKSEIFTKNVKEWPIEILNVNKKCPIIKILILITVIDCTEVFIEIPLSSMKPEKQNKVYQYGKSSQNLVNSIYFFPDEYG